MKVKFSDFTIIPVLDSIRNIVMDDETYFSSKYSKYISNSRLKNINPEEGGSPQQFMNPPHLTTSSLNIGSAVHEVLLQPESFVLAPKMDRPTAKLGQVIDRIWVYRQEGMSIYKSIKTACTKVGYYVNQIDKKIPYIIKNGLSYYLKISEPRWVKEGAEEIFLSNNDHDVVSGCLQSCYDNKDIMSKLHPVDVFGDPLESHNEDALFVDFVVTYKGTKCATLKFKLKIDNWTINPDEKQITLNDLKTTSKPVDWFMNEEYGSFQHYHYYRQLYCYGYVLWLYCQKKFGATKNTGWNMDFNILAVQTSPDKYNDGQYTSRCFNIRNYYIKKGKIEFEQLLKRVAASEIFGYENDIEFE